MGVDFWGRPTLPAHFIFWQGSYSEDAPTLLEETPREKERSSFKPLSSPPLIAHLRLVLTFDTFLSVLVPSHDCSALPPFVLTLLPSPFFRRSLKFCEPPHNDVVPCLEGGTPVLLAELALFCVLLPLASPHSPFLLSIFPGERFRRHCRTLLNLCP